MFARLREQGRITSLPRRRIEDKTSFEVMSGVRLESRGQANCEPRMFCNTSMVPPRPPWPECVEVWRYVLVERGSITPTRVHTVLDYDFGFPPRSRRGDAMGWGKALTPRKHLEESTKRPSPRHGVILSVAINLLERVVKKNINRIRTGSFV